jgi:hypothetical protein
MFWKRKKYIVEVCKTPDSNWYRVKAANGEIILTSEQYERYSDALEQGRSFAYHLSSWKTRVVLKEVTP